MTIDIATLVDSHLLDKHEREGKRPVTGGATFRASRLGACLRAQYLEAVVKAPPIVPITALTLRKFMAGDVYEEQFKQLFQEMGLLLDEQIELYDAELDVGANADFIIGDSEWKLGVECKSMNSMYFWYRTKESAPTTASLPHLLQAGMYNELCRRQGHDFEWVVMPVSRDDCYNTQDLVTQEHRAMALDRLATLRYAKETGQAPSCECNDPNAPWGGREWKWCPFYRGTDASTKQKRNAHPDGPCCEVPND